MNTPFFYKEVYTQLGTMGIVWSNGNRSLFIERILLPNEVFGENPLTDRIRTLNGNRVIVRAKQQVPKAISEIENILYCCIQGKGTGADLGIFNFTQCSDFQKAVLFAEYRVPPGWITTYGRIADKIGRPGSARAVGRALAMNPFPLIIPCHRAVRASGELGGYRGGVQMKQALLEHEGVRFTKYGQVLMNKVY